MRYLTVILLTWSVHFVLCAQMIEFSEASVRNAFDHPEKIQWTKHHIGVIDQFHPMEMWIAFDGSEYHGVYRYLTSQDIFQIQGYLDNGKAVLQEIDLKGNTSAYLMGTVSMDGMEGYWWNYDFSKRKSLKFIPIEIVELRPFEPEFLHIDGSLGNYPVQILLMKETHSLISGYIYLGLEGESIQFQGECTTKNCNELLLNFEADSETRTITCTKREKDVFAMQYETDGIQVEGQCEIMKSYPLVKETFASYLGSFDVLYPDIENPAYESWITGKIQELKEHHLDLFEEGVVALDNMTPQQRDKVSSTGWVDVSFHNEMLLSGILTFYNGQSDIYVRHPFVLDLKAGEEVDFQSVFKRDIDFEALRTRFVKEQKQIGFHDLDKDESNWFNNQGFNVISIFREGFALHSEFHPVFGERYLVMPYNLLSEVMKKRSIITQSTQ